MVPHEGSLVARIFANIFVWSFLVYGLFFLVIYKVKSLRQETPWLNSGTDIQTGLHPWLLAQLLVRIPRRCSVPAQGHRFPVDLCLRHHGRVVHLVFHRGHRCNEGP